MKQICWLALVFVPVFGTGVAAAVTPSTGNWKVTNTAAPTESNLKGSLQVYKSGTSLYVRNWLGPSVYTKCKGANAKPDEIDPGFEFYGAGWSKPMKLTGKSNKFSKTVKLEGKGGVVITVTGKFTAAKKATGTIRVQITADPERQCDSGAVAWSGKR